MNILWFTNTPSLYNSDKPTYFGGGWIESLESLLSKEKSIDLGISFFHKDSIFKIKKNNTTYYPLCKRESFFSRVKNKASNYSGSLESDNEFIPKLLEVIDDFKPDVINVFGTEGIFSGIQNYTDIPVVIHLQGLINPYLNTYFPPNTSKWSFLLNFKYLRHNLHGISPFFGYKRMRNQALREGKNMKNAKFIMGRTQWDKSFSKLYAPNAEYFHVNEVLRDSFYSDVVVTQTKKVNEVEIISTISPIIYKGVDVILKSAQLLKKHTNVNFSWKLIGIPHDSKILKFYEKELNLNHKKLGIKCIGFKNEQELKNIISTSDLFIHPSYIDNSPNSICEAQILGLPVIACNVGGISSIIVDKETGLLVPSNGIIEIVSSITKFVANPEYFKEISEKEKISALVRHDKSKIIKEITRAYAEILNYSTKL